MSISDPRFKTFNDEYGRRVGFVVKVKETLYHQLSIHCKKLEVDPVEYLESQLRYIIESFNVTPPEAVQSVDSKLSPEEELLNQ